MNKDNRVGVDSMDGEPVVCLFAGRVHGTAVIVDHKRAGRNIGTAVGTHKEGAGNDREGSHPPTLLAATIGAKIDVVGGVAQQVGKGVCGVVDSDDAVRLGVRVHAHRTVAELVAARIGSVVPCHPHGVGITAHECEVDGAWTVGELQAAHIEGKAVTNYRFVSVPQQRYRTCPRNQVRDGVLRCHIINRRVPQQGTVGTDALIDFQIVEGIRVNGAPKGDD